MNVMRGGAGITVESCHAINGKKGKTAKPHHGIFTKYSLILDKGAWNAYLYASAKLNATPPVGHTSQLNIDVYGAYGGFV